LVKICSKGHLKVSHENKLAKMLYALVSEFFYQSLWHINRIVHENLIHAHVSDIANIDEIII